MLTKAQLLSTVKNLPESFTIDELLEHLVFIQKVETGLKQSQKGKVYSETEAKKKLKKWLK
jgi:hypothetical protein